MVTKELKQIIKKYKNTKGNLIMALHAVQEEYGFVPKDVCFYISEELKIPIARIYEVLTFYNYFRLDAPARYKISVCQGTACYLKGASEVLKTIERKLNIKEGETTKDGLFKLETARCFGCCGLAPVATINGDIYGKLTPEKILNLLEKYQNGK